MDEPSSIWRNPIAVSVYIPLAVWGLYLLWRILRWGWRKFQYFCEDFCLPRLRRRRHFDEDFRPPREFNRGTYKPAMMPIKSPPPTVVVGTPPPIVLVEKVPEVSPDPEVEAESEVPAPPVPLPAKPAFLPIVSPGHTAPPSETAQVPLVKEHTKSRKPLIGGLP